MANKNFPGACYPTLKNGVGHMTLENINNDNKCKKNIEKKSQFLSKNAEARDVETLKPFHYQKSFCNNLSSNSRRSSLAHRNEKTHEMNKIFIKLEKMYKLV